MRTHRKESNWKLLCIFSKFMHVAILNLEKLACFFQVRFYLPVICRAHWICSAVYLPVCCNHPRNCSGSFLISCGASGNIFWIICWGFWKLFIICCVLCITIWSGLKFIMLSPYLPEIRTHFIPAVPCVPIITIHYTNCMWSSSDNVRSMRI